LKRVLQRLALAIGVLVLLLFGVLFGRDATLAWPLTTAQFLVYLGLPALEIAAIAATILGTRARGNALVYTLTVIWIVIIVDVTLAFLGVFGF
jgi:uncharacterized membrane protein (DUF485 family)